MPNVTLGSTLYRTDTVAGAEIPVHKIAHGVVGAETLVSTSNPLPVVQTGAATDATLTALRGDLADSAITGQGAQLALNQNIVLATAGAGSTDTLNYRSLGITITPAAGTVTAGVVTFEGSNDNTNFVPVMLYDTAAPANAPVTNYTVAASTTRYFAGPTLYRFFRARISTAVTGTTTGLQAFTVLRTQPFAPSGATQVASQTAGNFNVTASGTVTANIGTGSLAAGTNAIGDVGIQYRANATGAASKFHLVSAATTNLTNVKASAGRLLGWRVQNTNAAARYVKLHNVATAPTAGAGVVETIGVPPNSVVTGQLPGGSAFTTGIAISTVTGSADADTTAVAAGDLIIDLFFA